MDRRQVIVTTGAGLLAASSLRAQTVAPAAHSPSYSESVEMMLFAPEGGQDLIVRLGRLVGRRQATLWAGYGSAADNYRLATMAPLRSMTRTHVEADAATFSQKSPWSAQLERVGRDGEHMTGRVLVTAHAHASAEPPEGEGPLPAHIAMSFEALHRPVAVRAGRLEVFGHGKGSVHVAGRTLAFSGYAKWHEQVGNRPRFAPAFTYIALCGDRSALLAIHRGDSANGFALENGRTTAVTAVKVSPPGRERQFEATLSDGRIVRGAAEVLRTSSEPIEGHRRPSATVTANTVLGPLAGQINDWQPPE